ncbi:hypothetical protein BDR22DRAFT_574148 [Usnea florida]
MTTSGNTIYLPTATMLLLHFNLPGIYHVVTAALMTVEVVRHRQIGPLQAKTTGALMTVALITNEYGTGWLLVSLTEEDPSTVIGQRISPTRVVSARGILGHGAILDSWFFSNLWPDKIGQKALVSSHFFTFQVHQASCSIMRLSATNTSPSHPRCRHLATGAWLFSLSLRAFVTGIACTFRAPL